MRFRRLRDICEFVAINGRLFVAVVAAVVALAAMQLHTSSSKKECLGVVDLKETNISFDTSVIVKNVFVLPGQKVKKGQALLEVKPVETTMKLLELRSQLDQLISERDLVDSLFAKRSARSKNEQLSPVELQIDGLKKQIIELELSMKQAVRFAEEDGVVGSVNFRVSEQVAPFQPVITLNSTQPNLVYGFIHEDRFSDFRIGETVNVVSLNRKSKATFGRVVSLGNRITQFPERLTGGPQIQYWGREIVVSLPGKNLFMPGEKVRLVADENSKPMVHVLEAMAVHEDREHPKVVAYNLPFEASGMVFNPQSQNQLLMVSDDLNRNNGSPFWSVQLDQDAGSNHRAMPSSKVLSKHDDLESLSIDGDKLYAMGSLSSEKKGGRLVEFQIQDQQVILSKVIPVRSQLIANLKTLPTMAHLADRLDKKLEVEGFSVRDGKAMMALKKPLFADGSTVLIEITNFTDFVASLGQIPMKTRMVSPLFLRSEECPDSSRVTDLTYMDDDLLILTNCKDLPISQLWVFHLKGGMSYPTLINTYDVPHLEGLELSKDKDFVYLTDDNGNDGVSTVFKSPILKSW